MRLLLKNLLFTLVLPGTLGVYLPLWIAQGPLRARGVVGLAGLALLALGAAIYAWCVWDFATFGGGTPAPIDAPKRVVTRGLYRYVRNPMYIAVLALVLGQVLLFQSWGLFAYLVLIGTAQAAFVHLYEEPTLREAYGPPYDEFCDNVPRWLPRLTPWRAPRSALVTG